MELSYKKMAMSWSPDKGLNVYSLFPNTRIAGIEVKNAQGKKQYIAKIRGGAAHVNYKPVFGDSVEIYDKYCKVLGLMRITSDVNKLVANAHGELDEYDNAYIEYEFQFDFAEIM